MQVTRLSHANLTVDDVDQARRFYGEVLGLREIPRSEGATRPGVWFQIGDVELHLAFDPVPGNQASSRHIALEVTNLADVRRLLEQSGRPILEATPQPGMDRMFTRDPAGNRIELQQIAD